MATDNESEAVFHVGLCMAGAVSAGAYTAGVIDYLFEALNDWEKRRGQEGVPSHRVQIPVMGGASAGGMTSVMAATALNNPLSPVNEPGEDLMAEHPENKLYHSWVGLTGVDMFSQMLDTSDIDKGGIESGLNSSFIDPIAKRVVTVDTGKWCPAPAFTPPGLKLFTTLTNLQGFHYTADQRVAETQKGKYHMVIHNDYACFELTENDIEGPNNGWMPLNLKTGVNVDVAGDAAMATGAFPVGLKSRLLNRNPVYINENLWLKDYLQNNPLENQCNPYVTLNVDGGLINNEPFEKVRDVLEDISPTTDSNDNFNTFKSTVLMVEPFPTVKPTPISESQNLFNVMGLTLSSMISQMRSKPVRIKDALDSDCAGQFLITPAREITQTKNGTTETGSVAGEMAIACGALNGFSGFINKEFRVHDYFLGRYNCKIFLRDYFTVPAKALETNPIFRDGYSGIDKEQFKSHKQDDMYQIIPVFNQDPEFYKFPNFKFSSGDNWPVLQNRDIDKYKHLLKKRVQKTLLNISGLNGLEKFLIWAGCVLILNGFIAKRILSKIKADLRVWKLLPDNTQR